MGLGAMGWLAHEAREGLRPARLQLAEEGGAWGETSLLTEYRGQDMEVQG